MTSYIIAAIFAGAMILVAAFISVAVKFEGGADPSDPRKRKTWFWIFAIVNPILFYLLGSFIMAPKASDDQMAHDEYMSSLPVATAVGFLLYILIGFVLSKVFKNNKLGHWF